MKRVLLICLLLLLALTACLKQGEKQGELSNVDNAEASPSVNESVNSQLPKISSKKDAAFYENVLLAYGGDYMIQTSENQKSPFPQKYVSATKKSPYFIDDWNSVEKIQLDSLFTWYFIGSEEAGKNGFIPVDDLFSVGIVPQDYFESRIQKHFNISTEQLRSYSDYYDSNQQGYRISYSQDDGYGRAPQITVVDVEIDGELHKLHILIDYGGLDVNEEKILTIRLIDDGFYFESYTTKT